LQRPARHGGGGLTHALGHGLGIVIPSADVGKEKEWMPVKLPVTLEFVPQTGGQRHDAILVALAVADEQFVLGAFNVVDGQGQAFA